MVEYRMELTNEEKEILEGGRGETLQKMMKSVVMYGETFGAKRLLPVNGPVHLVTSFGIPILKPVFSIMDELIANGYTAKKPFTVNPRPLDYKNVKCSLPEKVVFKIMYGKQREYEEQLVKTGLKNKDAFSCTCYMPEVGNMPEEGEILAWAESSAVVFANSVLGARSNRNSGVIELFCGVLGKAPEFGLLTDEGRKAKWLVEVKTSKLPEAQVLGSAVGMKVIEDVPYIAYMDKFLGEGMNDKTRDYLKDMGAASASNGAVGLYHVENITPEAVNKKRELLMDKYDTYVIDDDEIERIKSSYPMLWKDENAKPKKCFIGCPHLSLNQIYSWKDRIANKLKACGRGRVQIDTVLCAAPGVLEEFKKDEKSYGDMLEMGLKFTSICPLMYMNNPLCAKNAIITNSNKLRTYTTARYFVDDEILGIISEGTIKGARV